MTETKILYKLIKRYVFFSLEGMIVRTIKKKLKGE
jgi:hypothetical protein